MAKWPYFLLTLVVGCGSDEGVGDSADVDVGDDAGTTDGADDATSNDDSATEATVDPSTDGSSDPDTTGDDDSSAGDSGPVGPTCGGFVWRAEMDVDPTTLDDNGDSTSDWEFNGGAFPADGIVDGVWQAGPDSYIRTLPDDPLANRVIVTLSMRTVMATDRGALFWANLGQDDETVTRLWLDVALDETGNQIAVVGGYSDAMTPEMLLNVPDLGTDFIDVVFDADPVAGEVAVTIAGVDHGTLSLPSYAGSNPQAAAVGALEANAEIDSVSIERCPD